MADAAKLHVLRIAVRPVPAINGHEVMLSSDGGELLAYFSDEFMGMEPAELLWEPSPLRAGAVAAAVQPAGASRSRSSGERMS